MLFSICDQSGIGAVSESLVSRVVWPLGRSSCRSPSTKELREKAHYQRRRRQRWCQHRQRRRQPRRRQRRRQHVVACLGVIKMSKTAALKVTKLSLLKMCCDNIRSELPYRSLTFQPMSKNLINYLHPVWTNVQTDKGMIINSFLSYQEFGNYFNCLGK